MSEWRELAVEDLCVRVTSGGTPSRKRADFYADDGIPWVKSQELVEAKIAVTEEHISEAGLKGSSAKLLPPNTVLLAMYGANVGQLGWLGVEATVNQAICAMVTDPEVTDSRFLYYALAGARVNLIGKAHGAAQQNLSQQLIRPFKLAVPDLATQRGIGEILRSIDDLIENNRRRVEVLEEMARAIYREWFVKFRYPGHGDVPMVDSDLGPIPEGWNVQALTTIATVNRSSRKPGADETFKYLDITALSERYIGELDSIAGSQAPGRARRVVGPGDTVWATVRPNRRAHALVVTPGDDWIASTGLAVLTPSGVSPAFLFETTSTTAFSDWLVGRATGSAYPAVRAKDFEVALVIVPDVAVDAAFAEKVSPMHELSWNLRVECSALTKLRDLLLPKLVTGQIDVSTLDLDALIAEQVA
ncbi:restriction endonuclease subunit S [Ornithinimicrobium murale]|uniref:restriction endonuclease subunit S n=1 Tax=Ornithinimicrobium murale TaxID=1050153 RepID=UPI000E0DC1F9|nr:restriction endonuclease subunit S [Ornithinimicrobium murale]